MYRKISISKHLINIGAFLFYQTIIMLEVACLEMLL